jgi:hypothetical protein
VFWETKTSLILSYNKASGLISKLNRRESEMVRTNFNTVKKLGVFFFVQLPPIIGTIPVKFHFFIFVNLNSDDDGSRELPGALSKVI